MIESNHYCGKFRKKDKQLYDRAVFWFRQLFRDVCSQFVLEGAPETVNQDYFFSKLALNGSLIMQSLPETKGFPAGVYALTGAHYGVDPYMWPTDTTIANGVLGNFSGKIGVDSAWIRFNKFAEPIIDTLNQYAERLASLDIAIQTNISNCYTARVFSPANDLQAQQIRKMYDDISAGQPAVICKKSVMQREDASTYVINNDTNYLVHDFIQDQIAARGEFFALFGIMSQPMEKGERLITGEVKSQMQQIEIGKNFFLGAMNEDLKKANKLFGTSMEVKIIEPPKEDIQMLDGNKGGDLDDTERESNDPAED